MHYIITLYIVINLFYYVLNIFFFLSGVPACMAINVVSVRHNGGFLPGILYC